MKDPNIKTKENNMDKDKDKDTIKEITINYNEGFVLTIKTPFKDYKTLVKVKAIKKVASYNSDKTEVELETLILD